MITSPITFIHFPLQFINLPTTFINCQLHLYISHYIEHKWTSMETFATVLLSPLHKICQRQWWCMITTFIYECHICMSLTAWSTRRSSILHTIVSSLLLKTNNYTNHIQVAMRASPSVVFTSGCWHCTLAIAFTYWVRASLQIYGIWRQANWQTNDRHTHGSCNTGLLVWGLLRLLVEVLCC